MCKPSKQKARWVHFTGGPLDGQRLGVPIGLMAFDSYDYMQDLIWRYSIERSAQCNGEVVGRLVNYRHMERVN